MTEAEIVKLLIKTLGYNSEWEGWTLEKALELADSNARKFSRIDMSNQMIALRRLHDEDLKGRKAELERRNADYGRLAGKYQRLQRNHRALTKSMPMKVVADNNVNAWEIVIRQERAGNKSAFVAVAVGTDFVGQGDSPGDAVLNLELTIQLSNMIGRGR